jgi:hypothetical protein
VEAWPLVVDVDAHYYEDPRSFARYLDERCTRSPTAVPTRAARWAAGASSLPHVKVRLGADGRVQEYQEDESCILACPWHGWEFDVRDGHCLWNRGYHLRTYTVEEDADGNVLI